MRAVCHACQRDGISDEPRGGHYCHGCDYWTCYLHIRGRSRWEPSYYYCADCMARGPLPRA
jgi:hypothetical protein